MDPDKQAEQRRQVRNAAQSLLGCGGLIALVALGYWLLGRLPASVATGPNVIRIIDTDGTTHWLFWGVVVSAFLLLVALGFVKTTLGAVVVCAVYAGAVVATVMSLYGPFAAVAIEPNAVELRFVWPRPAARFAPAEIQAVNVEQVAHTGDSLHVVDYILHVRTERGEYSSYSTPNNTPQVAADRIEATRKRR